MNRWIAHIDLDAFFVSVEVVLNPSLKGKAVIVGGDPDVGRGVVAAASYQARKFGIHSAMPISRAKRLCPHAIFLRGNHKLYSRASEAVFRIVGNYTPFLEVVSIDEAYLDLSGFERLYGHPLKALERMKLEVKEKLHLTMSAGLASNRLLAKVASAEAKPDGIICILPGYEESFLAPLPIEKLPGVGEKMKERLNLIGVKKVRDIVVIGEELMETIFGETGVSLYWRARGKGDDRIDMDDSMPKSVGHETTFDEDSNDVDFLENNIYYLAEKVGRRLRKKGLRGYTITLKLRYSDFVTLTRSQTIPEATNFDAAIFQVASALFRKGYTRRMKVRLLGVSVCNITSNPWQLGLFTPAFQLKLKDLYRGIDQVREKYGFDSLSCGRSNFLRVIGH
ncbi:MAG: DNA polymerase IV [Acidobacteriota bacterium]